MKPVPLYIYITSRRDRSEAKIRTVPKDVMDLKNKKVTVVGLGNSGMNAAILLYELGADVYVTDSRDTPEVKSSLYEFEHRSIRAEIGGHTKDFISGSSLVVVSPGVEDSSPAVRWAEDLNIPIISEMELGYTYCKGRIIAVTGTNGKSTVTSLIGEMLKDGLKDTVVCGNIGNSLCGEISRISRDTWVVLEVSSFQLERIKIFKPHIALILNITDDHLDRYKTFKEYFAEKLKIFQNQTKDDYLILNYDAQNLRPLKDKARSKVLFYSSRSKTNGAYLKDERMACVWNGSEKEVARTDDLGLEGLHNLENVLASSLAGILAGVSGESLRNTIKNFKGLPHRFETVAVIDGVRYIDDSKATTVDSTYRALESCKKPVILIAGGRDKNSDYGVIKELVKKKVRHLILIGEAKDKIRNNLAGAVETHDAKDMFEAVRIASGLAKKDFLVLLSPMCSSFDMFKSYKDRGEVFKDAVKKQGEESKRRQAIKI